MDKRWMQKLHVINCLLLVFSIKFTQLKFSLTFESFNAFSRPILYIICIRIRPSIWSNYFYSAEL